MVINMNLRSCSIAGRKRAVQRYRTSEKWSFSRDDTLAAKGVAIVLMLLHHAFNFSNRISPSFYQISFISLGNTSLMDIFADYGKICVALFFFLSGFGLVKSRGTSVGVKILRNLKKLFSSYWRVLFSFVPVGFFSLLTCLITMQQIATLPRLGRTGQRLLLFAVFSACQKAITTSGGFYQLSFSPF